MEKNHRLELGWRLLSSLVMVVIVGMTLYFKNIGVLTFLTFLIILMGVEWVSLANMTARIPAIIAFISIISLALFLTFFGHLLGAIGVLSLGVGLSIIISWVTWRSGFLWLALGLVYVGLPCSLLLWVMHGFENAVKVLIWMIITVSCNDIGGYVVGKIFKGPKLLPSISPNKTWSGALGGFAFSLIGATVFFYYYPFAMEIHHYLFATWLMAVMGTLGDLIESAIKRYHGVKESGAILPGHGGLFDRLDGFLMAIPVMALMVYMAPEAFDEPETPPVETGDM